jgi:peptidoglycan/xylan/chitin deacetylase (PgdA/CDA1 family)
MQFAPLYPLLYQVLKPVFPGCLWRGDPQSKAIALTFDDGPHPQNTPPLLAVLNQYQIPASFFWLGVCVHHSPDVARAIYQSGHWIGLHGYTHRPFPLLSNDVLKQDLDRTKQAIAQACSLDPSGTNHLQYVRPPYGVALPQTLNYLKQWNYRPVMWSVVPEDWARPGINTVVARVLRQTQNGSLIVLHDGYTGGEDVAAIAAKIIPALLTQGYEFVTVDQFWQATKET